MTSIGIGTILMAVALAAATVVTGAIILLQIFSKPRGPDGGGPPSA